MARIRIIRLVVDRDGNPILPGISRWDRLHYDERLGYYGDGEEVIICDAIDGLVGVDGAKDFLVTGAVHRLPAQAKRQDVAIADDGTLLTRATVRGFREQDGRLLPRSVLAGDGADDDEIRDAGAPLEAADDRRTR